MEDGLADTITWREMIVKNPKIQLPSSAKPDEHFVQILDPATGTATFLVEVIDAIHKHLAQKWKAEGKTKEQQKDAWQKYVPQHLLPRLYGYEIMMAPYAVAHMKISLKLQETGYSFTGKEGRIHVYLTNALEPHQEQFKLPDFEPLAKEALAVNEIKKNSRFTILLGNPPYSVKSQNKGKWITQQIRENYYPSDEIKERKITLTDDYVKFFRFVEYTLATTGIGILGYITNHAWIDNPTFRRMRQSLLETFSRISVLDLHGNARKKETAPDGSKDQNVFDIQQGVAITLGNISLAPVKSIQHAEFYGSRKTKETALENPENPKHSQPSPTNPFYFIIPHNESINEYEEGWKVTDIFPLSSSAIMTNRNALTIHESKEKLWEVVLDFASLSKVEAMQKYTLKDARDWKVELAQQDLMDSGPSKDYIQPILFRPFDTRWTYYTGRTLGFICWPRPEVMKHMIGGNNVALIACRQFAGRKFFTVNCANGITEVSSQPYAPLNLFPLWLYPGGGGEMMEEKRRANFSDGFLKALSDALGLEQADGLPRGISPEDIFGYIYAILHSPKYRRRYRDFLRIDFPRIPLPKSLDSFRRLSAIGNELVSYHLMTHPKLKLMDVQHFGNSKVVKVGWTKDNGGTVWLDGKGNRNNFQRGTSGFSPVPEEVWKHHIGGYQVCEKWLKDRIAKKEEPPRILSDEEILHYRRIICAISKTREIMEEIDKVIDSHGGFEGA